MMIDREFNSRSIGGIHHRACPGGVVIENFRIRPTSLIASHISTGMNPVADSCLHFPSSLTRHPPARHHDWEGEIRGAG
jgi:hypothetical protein